MAANFPEQCHNFNETDPPTLLLWQTVLGRKKNKKKGQWQHLRKNEGLELLFSAGREQNAFSFCLQSHGSHPVTQIWFSFCRSYWIRFCRGTAAERLTAPWWCEPGPSVSPWTWKENGPFTGHDLAVAKPLPFLPFLSFHVNLNICSSER